MSVGYAYQAPLERAGGRAAYSWAIASGALPAGMALGPAGVIHGRSTSLGTSTVTIRLTDGLGAVATRVLTIRVVRPEKAYVGLLESHVSPDGSQIFVRGSITSGGQIGSRLIVMSAATLGIVRTHDFPNVWSSVPGVMATDGRTLYWLTSAHFDGGLNGT